MQQKSDHTLAQIIWDYMRYEQPLVKADLIVGFGSSDIRTAEHCAKLWHEGWAAKIVFCGARGKITRDVFTENEADVYADKAVQLGVPPTNITLENRSTNSGENVQYLYDVIQQQVLPHKTIILVHKPYMLRRAYATLMKQWPSVQKPKVMTSAIGLDMDEYVTNAYIDLAYMTNIMVGDLQRIIEYPKLGYQIEQEVPKAVMLAYGELVRRGYTKHLLTEV